MRDTVIQAPIPQWYNIEITSHCNLNCPYCPTGCGDITLSERGYLSDADFEIIFNKIKPYAKAVQLFNWGEPFMHKRLCSFIETFTRHGIMTQISSNLTVRLFDEQELERIVSSGLYSLLASIDGVTQQAYSAYRKNGDVKKALLNLENLQKTKARLGAVTPHLIWGFYLNIHNQHEIDKARHRGAEMNIDIWFKELSCPAEFQTTLLNTQPEVFATPKDIQKLWIGRNNNGLGHFELDKRLPQICNVCRMPFEIMVINFNGDVYPCTAMTGRNFRVGNLLEETLEDIWDTKMAENRRQLLCITDKRTTSQCFFCEHFPEL